MGEKGGGGPGEGCQGKEGEGGADGREGGEGTGQERARGAPICDSSDQRLKSTLMVSVERSKKKRGYIRSASCKYI